MRKSGSAQGLAILAAALVALGPVACSNTVEGLKKDAEENKVQEKTEKAAESIKAGAEKVSEAVSEAGKELRTKAQALEVKAALMADKGVDASRIDVDSDDATQTITLKGSVPTAGQRTAAEAIARKKAEGYRIENNLTVAALR